MRRAVVIGVFVTIGVLVFLGSLWIYKTDQQALELNNGHYLNGVQVGLLKFRATILDQPDAQYALGQYERFVNLNFSASDRWIAMAANRNHAAALYFIAAEKLGSGQALTAEEQVKALETMRNAERAGSRAAKEYFEVKRLTKGNGAGSN